MITLCELYHNRELKDGMLFKYRFGNEDCYYMIHSPFIYSHISMDRIDYTRYECFVEKGGLGIESIMAGGTLIMDDAERTKAKNLLGV
jgi:hypothetical protein